MPKIHPHNFQPRPSRNARLAAAIYRLYYSRFLCFLMLYVPFSPANDCYQPPQQRRKTNRFALVLFTLTALAGLLTRYLL